MAPGLALLLPFLSATAQQPTNTVCTAPWSPIGSNVYVHLTAVGDGSKPTSMWTWCFRNQATRAIVYLTFGYTDAEGDHSDILPGSLKSGGSFGGWAAFTSTGRPTRMWIKEIKYQGDDEAAAARQRQQQEAAATANAARQRAAQAQREQQAQADRQRQAQADRERQAQIAQQQAAQIAAQQAAQQRAAAQAAQDERARQQQIAVQRQQAALQRQLAQMQQSLDEQKRQLASQYSRDDDDAIKKAYDYLADRMESDEDLINDIASRIGRAQPDQLRGVLERAIESIKEQADAASDDANEVNLMGKGFVALGVLRSMAQDNSVQASVKRRGDAEQSLRQAHRDRASRLEDELDELRQQLDDLPD